MKNIYVVSDIHGRRDLFELMLSEINLNKEDLLIVLGDVIDRGEHSISTLKLIMKTDNIEMLRGNHEQMMLEYYDNPRDDNWLYNGGHMTRRELTELGESKTMDILQYCRNLPFTKTINVDDKKFILCHAGVHVENDGAISDIQSPDFLLWARNEFFNGNRPNDTVIFGHTPTSYLGTDDIYFGDNIIGIDCGAVFTNKLGCLRLNDMKEFYVISE